MAIANHFYNQTTRKYVALFGNIFNQLTIERTTNDGSVTQKMIVPLSYAPFQKVLARVTQDPDLLNSRRTAITLPRMSFEITNMQYDSQRKLASTRRLRKEDKAETSTGGRNFVYNPVPYNIDFSLYIMTKYAEDATQIMEQILPFFTPDWTVTARMIDDLDPFDIPIIMNSVTMEELYEGDFVERQSVLYTLTFTLKGWYFGPERERKVIKFIEMNYATSTEANAKFEERVTVRPGMTANGTPLDIDGVRALASATLSGGSVASFTIINNGENYDANNVIGINISAPDSANAVIVPVLANTALSSFNITEPGGYYSVVPNITLSAPDAPSTTATASAVISNDSIDSITVTNNGTYYSSANVSIEEPPAKSPYVKFGDDALFHDDYEQQTLIHTTTQELNTSSNGFAVEFWIYPTEFHPNSLIVMHWAGSTMRVGYESNGTLIYRPAYNNPPVRSTPEVLVLNQWNHCRLEHVGNTARWLVNGVVDDGGTAPQGYIMGGGIAITAGQRAANERSFIGSIDNAILTQITSLTPVGTYTVPTAPQTGSDMTANFDKDKATADAVVLNGEVVAINVTNNGSNYANTTPVITISAPDGNPSQYQAVATAVLTNGAVNAITINNSGKFYNSITATIDAPTSIQATANVSISALGEVSSINLTNPGAGYRSVPTVTIDGPAATSVPYTDIEFDDNWGIITVIEEI